MRRTVLAILVSVVGITSADAQEPVYEGKPLSAWLELLKSTDVGTRRSAAAQLAQRINFEARHAAVPLAEVLQDDDRKVRVEIAKAINKLGPQGIEQVLLHLVQELNRLNSKHSAARALGEMGVTAKPALGHLATKMNAQPVDKLMRVVCARAIAAIDPRWSKGVTEVLASSLKDPAKEVRVTAAEGLGDLGGFYSSKSLPALYGALKDNNAEVRLAAARAIPRVDRREILKGVPALVQIVKDPGTDARLRAQAAEVLGEFGPVAKTAIEQLRPSLTSNDPMERLAVASAMAMIDKQSGINDAVPVFIAALKDADAEVRLAAAEALKSFGGDGKAAVPALINALKTEGGNFTLYVTVLDAVAKVGEPAVPAVVAAIDDATTEPALVRALIECVGKVGKPAKDAAPALVKVLKDRRKVLLHRSAVAALGKIGAPAIPVVKPLLKEADAKTRLAAVSALSEMGSEAKTVVSDLREVAKSDAEEAVKNAAIAAVRKLDPFGPLP